MKYILIAVLFSVTIFATELTLGVVPQQSPLKLAKKWIQVTDYLSEKTGVKIVFKTENSIPAFQKELYAGKYDLAYMNPYHFVVANEKQNYEAAIRADKLIKGIFVSKGTTFNPEDFKGKTFLFPAPKAFAATLVTKYELKEKFGFDIDKEAKVMYVNSHDSVYKGVARGIGDFGGGIVRTYNNFEKNKDKSTLNIVYTTKGYPSHPIAFHPKISKEIQNKIIEAFLTMPEDLKKILSIKNFIKTDTKEYEIIKKFE